MQSSLQGLAQGFQQVGGAAGQTAPAVKQADTALRDLGRSAGNAATGVTQMLLSMRGGIGSFPQLALGLRQAVVGLQGMSAGLAQLSPAMHDVVLGYAVVGTATAAMVATVGAAAISLFRFSQQMNVLAGTAKSMGVSFGELKHAIDEGSHFGATAETIISGFAGIGQAQANLAESGSSLRQRLLGLGVGAGFLAQFQKETDPVKAQQLLWDRAKVMRESLQREKMPPMAIAGRLAEFGQEFGQDPAAFSRPRPTAQTPYEKGLNKSIEDQSAKINDIWAEISHSIKMIGFAIADWGLTPLVLAPLELAKRLFDEIDTEVNLIKKDFDWIWGQMPEWFKTVVTGMAAGPGDKDQPLAPLPPGAAGAPRTFGDSFVNALRGVTQGLTEGGTKLGPGQSGAAEPLAPYTPEKISYTTGAGTGANDNVIPLLQRASFTTEELTQETGKNTTEVGRLTDQITKLNDFLDRYDTLNAARRANAPVPLASGGSAFSGREYVVGENGPEVMVPKSGDKPYRVGALGPELMVPPTSGTVLPNAGVGKSVTGRGSWFGQHGNWADPGDVDKRGRSLGNTAEKYGQDVPGIATPGREGLGQLFVVTDPSGKEHVVRKVDMGPGKRTGRAIDINPALAERMGYSAESPIDYKKISTTTFPTDAKFTYRRAAEGATPSYPEPTGWKEVWSGDTSGQPKSEGALQQAAREAAEGPKGEGALQQIAREGAVAPSPIMQASANVMTASSGGEDWSPTEGVTSPQPAAAAPQGVDWSKTNIATGEATPTTSSPTEQAQQLLQRGMVGVGASEYNARVLSTGIKDAIQAAPIISAPGALADLAYHTTEGASAEGAALDLASLVPGGKHASRLAKGVLPAGQAFAPKIWAAAKELNPFGVTPAEAAEPTQPKTYTTYPKVPISGNQDINPVERPSVPISGNQTFDRAAISRPEGIRSSANLNVEVKQSPGFGKVPSSDDLLKPTPMQRSVAFQETQSGPTVSDTARQYMGGRS